MPDVLEPPAPKSHLFQPITGRPWERARQMRLEGCRWPEITAATAIPDRTLRQRAAEEGWDAQMVPAAPAIAPKIAEKSDQLRVGVIDASLASLTRMTERVPPRTPKQEREFVSTLSILISGCATACGWAEQDRLVGGVLAGQVESAMDEKRESAPPKPGPTVEIPVEQVKTT